MSHSKEFKAKKSLGQNFLMDQEVLQDIAGTLKLKNTDNIVEIGPGHGELTRFLLESGAKVVAIEKDSRLTFDLKQLTSDYKNLEILYGDALRLLPSLVSESNVLGRSGNGHMSDVKSYKLCGNIPYYITGQLFRIISELKNRPTVIVFTIQKEVAERICAKPGDMNILAASVQIWAKPEIVRIIPRTAFSPSPKVDSAVIKLTPKKNQLSDIETQNFYKLLKVLFKQPRKTILNNLKEFSIAGIEINKDKLLEILINSGINPEGRPQDLSLREIAQLGTILSK